MAPDDIRPQLPRYIAICGNPKSGKSLVQEILFETYGVQPVDDGEPLRQFAIDNLGLTWEDAYTQVGKLRSTEILGQDWQHRKILGEFGDALEALFGKHIMPFMAVARSRQMPGHSFSFGSVRRDQGLFYKKQPGGALVIGIDNPSAGSSNYEFDSFDRSTVDVWINNDALFRGLDQAAARKDLETKVWAVLAAHTIRKQAAA